MFFLKNSSFDPVTVTSGASNFPMVWLLVLGGLSVLGIIFSLFSGKRNSVLSFALIFGLTVMIIIFFTAVLFSYEPESKHVVKNIEETQEWVQTTYLVDLSDKETEKLIDGRINQDSKHVTNVKGSALGEYYGEKIFVQLVKYDDKWYLFSNDKELPKTK